MTAGPVKAGGEDGNYLQYILGEFFLERRAFALMNYHDFDALNLAECEHQVSTETEESILMRQDKPLHLPSENALQQFTESLLVIVHARAKVTDNLCATSLCGAVGFQHLKLAGEGIFLVPTTDTSTTNRRRVEGFQSHQIGGGVVARSALRFTGREQLARFFPPTHRFTGSAEIDAASA